MKQNTQDRIRWHSEQVKKLEIDKQRFENLLIKGSFNRRNNYGGILVEIMTNIRYHIFAISDVIKEDDSQRRAGFQVDEND